MGEIRENLKRNLGYYLSLKGISQKELADKLGVSQSAVTNWVKGKNSPDIEVVAEICKIFDISITDLMGKTSEQKPQAEYINLSSDEKMHIVKYRLLNENGKTRVNMYLDDLIDITKYIKYDEAQMKSNIGSVKVTLKKGIEIAEEVTGLFINGVREKSRDQ